MLLYILSSLILLISLISLSSSNDIECGYVIWSINNNYFGYPLGVCQVLYNDNYKYVCDGNGPIVKKLYYDTTDCSGEPSNTVDNICDFFDVNSCETKCDTNLCNNFITNTYYKSSDCSGNDITQRDIYLKNVCLGLPSDYSKYLCNGTEIIQFNSYSYSDCLGNNTQLENKYNTSCISWNDDTSYKWDGCGVNDDDCPRFKIFIAIIIVFIHVFV